MNEAKNIVSARIPFGGFYQSIWDQQLDSEMESTVDNWMDDREAADRDLPDLHLVRPFLDGDVIRSEMSDWLWQHSNFSEAHATIAKEYAEEFVSWLDDTLEADISGEFEEMTSPRFYNFETDRLFVGISLEAFEEIKATLDGEGNAVRDKFREMFTSRDGFISHYDNAVPDKALADWDHNELYALLCAWVEHQDVENIDFELYDYRCGGLYETIYSAASDAVDWEAVREACADWVEEQLEELGIDRDAEQERTYRCPHTLELPLSN